MSEHAPFSPSVMKRIINCPGSWNASKNAPPQKPNFYSAEGTVAHAIAASALEEFRVQQLWSKHDSIGWGVNGKYYPDGIEVTCTEEMIDAVRVYVDFVQELEKRYDETSEIERKVKITDDCFGTADSIIYSPYRILIVNDYKHGAGIQVDAEMNEQMMIYAIGKLLELPEDEQAELPLIQMNIIQPRGSGEAIKTFEIRRNDLIVWFTAVLIPAINAAKQPNAPLNPGDWCKYCPAALTCPALKKENLAVAKLAFEEPTKWVDVLTPKQIAELLDKESMVMAFYKRLNEYAAELASKNTKIPGYIYEKKWGNRKWKDEQAVYEYAASKNFHKNLIEVSKLKSPRQLENIIPGIDMIKLTEKPFTGYALKKANGKEITVKEVFNDVD
jgi:hypothetical protein